MPRSTFTGPSRRLGSYWSSISTAMALVIVLATLSANAQDAARAQLFKYPNTALNGITAAEVSKSADECHKICVSRAGCAGFDHSEKGVCRIFASVSSARTEPGARSETRSLIPGYHDPENPPLAARFEKLKQTDSSGDGLLALSHDAFSQGDPSIGNQAIQLAMQRGNVKAKLEIAKWYDPRTFAADRVAAIDSNKAARAYFELALEGNSDAVSLLTSLCREASNTGSAFTGSFDSFLGSTYCEGSLNP